jgi:hypothetical protein
VQPVIINDERDEVRNATSVRNITSVRNVTLESTPTPKFEISEIRTITCLETTLLL